MMEKTALYMVQELTTSELGEGLEGEEQEVILPLLYLPLLLLPYAFGNHY